MNRQTMGKTNPTHRDLTAAWKDEWQPYRRALRYEARQRFDRLYEGANLYTMAGGALNPADVERTIVMGMLLTLVREIDELQEIRNED